MSDISIDEAVKEFILLGYNEEDSKKLAELSKLGGGVADIDCHTAQKYLKEAEERYWKEKK